MTAGLREVPLFPLKSVLFPHGQLMLHIFEERYQLMMRRCQEESIPFGIVLIREGEEAGDPRPETFLVGTLARVVNLQSKEDSTIDISVKGEGRFRIRRIDDSLPYLVGHVEDLKEEDLPDGPRTDALIYRARECAEAYISAAFDHVDVNVTSIRFPEDGRALSFLLSSIIEADLLEKQHLLETTDTTERLKAIIGLIESALDSADDGLELVSADEVIERLSAN